MMLDRTIQPTDSDVRFGVNACPEVFPLSNGIKMHVVRMHSTPIVQLCLMFRGGQWFQTKPLQAALTYKLIKEGTRSYPPGVIDERLDYYGAIVGASVNMSEGHLVVQCLKEHLPQVLPIVVDMISNPLFEEDKLALAVSQAKVSHDVNMRTVGENSKRLFYTNIFGPEHPMSRFPQAADHDNVFKSDLIAYASDNFTPSRCVAFLTGDINEDVLCVAASELEKLVDEHSESYKAKGVGCSYKPEGKRFVKNMEEPTVQASVRVGALMVPRTHPDYIPLMVLTTLYGGYFGSRLMSNIRESKGYTYGISSYLTRTPENTLMTIQTETANEFVENVISEIYYEMERLSSEHVPDEELHQVKRYILGNMCRAYETNLNFYQRLITLDINGMSLSDVIEDSRRIEQLSPKDLMNVARRYLVPNRMIECIAM